MKLKRKKGTSLFELMLVLSIFVIIVTSFYGYISFSDHVQVRQQALAIAEFLYQMQQRALVYHQDSAIECNSEKNCYSDAISVWYLNSGVRFGVPPGVLGPPSAPKHPITNAITFDKKTILCSKDGHISSGALYLTDEQKRVCYAVTTPISEMMLIRVYKYEQGAWSIIS